MTWDLRDEIAETIYSSVSGFGGREGAKRTADKIMDLIELCKADEPDERTDVLAQIRQARMKAWNSKEAEAALHREGYSKAV